jgi:hypothetical protein
MDDAEVLGEVMGRLVIVIHMMCCACYRNIIVTSL